MGIVMLGVFSIAWFASAVAFGSTVRDAYTSLSSNLFEGPIVTRTAYQPTGFLEVSSFVVRIYGAAVAYIGIAMVVATFNGVKLFSKVKNRVSVTPLVLSFLLWASIVFSFVFLFYGLQIGTSVTRMVKYPVLVSILILGVCLAPVFSFESPAKPSRVHPIRVWRFPGRRIPSTNRNEPGLGIACVFLVFAVALISTFNSYPNLATHGYSYQVTEQDFAAMSTFFKHRNASYLIDEVLARSIQVRFAQALYGVETTLPGLRNGYEPDVLPPAHFGYDRGRFLGSWYSGRVYLLVPSLSQNYYPSVHPGFEESWRYTPGDFALLGRDPTVNQIYDSGGVQILLVDGT